MSKDSVLGRTLSAFAFVSPMSHLSAFKPSGLLGHHLIDRFQTSQEAEKEASYLHPKEKYDWLATGPLLYGPV